MIEKRDFADAFIAASYQSLEFNTDYLNNLGRKWEQTTNEHSLHGESVAYGQREIEAAHIFVGICERAGVRSVECTSTPSGAERRMYEYNPLVVAVNGATRHLACPRQVYYLTDEVGSKHRSIRSMLPMIRMVEQREDSEPTFINHYKRPDLQYIDSFALGVRCTPFYGTGQRNHLDFLETLKRCSQDAREDLIAKTAAQKYYRGFLNLLQPDAALPLSKLSSLFDYVVKDSKAPPYLVN